MAGEEKPYRVYRGGRVKGKVPTATPRPGRPVRDGATGRGNGRSEYRGPGARPAGPRQVRWGRRIGLGLLVLLVLVVIWGVTSWFSFSSGVSDANKRLDPIDELGGIDVDVPKPIRSNRFDCPYSTQARCQKWDGWRFAKGKQHMSGERALIYSRIRENMLDPSETDVTRGARQQDVMNAVAKKFTSFGVLLRMPFSGSSFAKPLATDMTAGQLVQLGW